jgi:hypothetical protein
MSTHSHIQDISSHSIKIGWFKFKICFFNFKFKSKFYFILFLPVYLDCTASYLGLKELVPPYLDPNLSDDELMTGVSFASAGSGFDPLTPTLSVQLSNSLNILS